MSILCFYCQYFPVVMRQFDTSQDSALVLSQRHSLPVPLHRLIQNKNMKSTILVDYQKQFGTDKLVTTANVSSFTIRLGEKI